MNGITRELLSIRQSHSGELLKLLRIQGDALRTFCTNDYTCEQIEALIDRSIYEMSEGRNRDEITLVASVGETIVGFSSLMRHHISAVYVHPRYARQGIGSCLLHNLEVLAVMRGIKSLRVSASLNAKQFYLRNGYSILGESYLFLTPEQRVRCVVMEKSQISIHSASSD